MAQTGYTPISFYYSSTSSNIPSAGNLVPGEIAINTADGVIYYKNSGGSVVPLQFGSTGISWQSVQTANFTAVAGNGYPVNTTSGEITVLLPATPAAGDLVTLTDYAGTFATNNLTIDPNGNKLLASTDAVLMATNNESLSFVYIDATQGWLPYDGFNSSIPATALYLLQASLRFRSSNSAFLNRTLSTPTNNKIWTVSAWVKRGALNNFGEILSGGANGSVTFGEAFFQNNNTLQYFECINGITSFELTTSAVFTDPAAWYHVVFAIDTTQAVGTNRAKIYVNGVQQTLTWLTTPAQNYATVLNSSGNFGGISAVYTGSAWAVFSDQYISEMNFIDGQALTPSSFGKVDTTTGSWIPIKYTGTYGTNGFYLKFTNTSSVAALGTDFSGNGNTWTVNNVSLTSGSTYDSMYDVPTLTSATKANYPTWNPLSSGGTISNGNLTYLATSGGNAAFGTFGMSGSGKYYFEVTIDVVSTNANIGIINETFTGFSPSQSVNWGAESVTYRNNGQKYLNGSFSSYGASYTSGDVIGIAVDCGAGTIEFFKNNISQGVLTSSTINGHTNFALAGQNVGAVPQYSLNHGQQPFVYTPPTGYVALNTFNL